MDIIPFFIPDSQSSLMEQPIERRLHDIAELSQSAAVFGVPFGDPGPNASLSQRLTDFLFGIISPIGKQVLRTPTRTTAGLSDRRNAIHQRQGHFRFMHIGSRMFDRQWGSPAIDNQMAFRSRLAPIRGIRPGFRPPKTARREQLSIAAVDQSMASALPRSFNKACQIFFQIPAFCQSRRRRQQVIPLPHPISWGRYSQGVPVLRTNKIPVRQARLDTRGRPPLGWGGSGGKYCWMRSHKSSVNSGLAIVKTSGQPISNFCVALNCWRFYRTNRSLLIRFC
jgi:hypothetical protein